MRICGDGFAKGASRRRSLEEGMAVFWGQPLKTGGDAVPTRGWWLKQTKRNDTMRFLRCLPLSSSEEAVFYVADKTACPIPPDRV